MIAWANVSGGDWDTAANWQGGAIPGPGDDAVIAIAVSNPITHAQNIPDSINSLSITGGAPLTLSGGALQIAGTLDSNGSVTLSGGTLANATVTAATTITGSTSAGTLSAITLAGILDLRSASGVVGVENGLTLAGGTVELGNAAGTTFGELYFVGGVAQNVDGASAASPGTILFGLSQNNSLLNYLGGTVTFGRNLTIEGSAGTIEFGNSGFPFDIQGTVLADPSILNTPAGTFTLFGKNWSNHGTIEAVKGDSLILNGFTSGTGPAWTNAAGQTISIAGGGSLTLQGSGTPFNGMTWQNQGSISETGSTVYLGGTFTMAGLGSFFRLAGPGDGSLILNGTLNNSGQTLHFDSSTGSWNDGGGTINGGTISAAPGFALIGTSQSGTLNGVTLDGTGGNAPSPVDLVSNSGVMGVEDGLTLAGCTVQLGNTAGTTTGLLDFVGGAAQTVDGASAASPGTILFGLGQNNSLFDNQGGTVTFGRNLTIEGSAGTIDFSNGGGPFDIQGTVLADPTILNTAAGTFTLDGQNWSNHGTIEAHNGDSLVLAGVANGTVPAWTNAAGQTVRISGGGSLSLLGNGTPLNGMTWQNQGSIKETGSKVNLGGTFTMAGLGSFSRQTGPGDGSVFLTGTLNNSGQSLHFDNSTGSWNDGGGIINGGTISAAPGFALIGTSQSGTLNGVTLDGTGGNAASPVDLASVGGVMDVEGGLTLDGSTLQLGNAAGTTSGVVYFVGGVAQTVDGASAANPGTILFGLSQSNSLFNYLGGMVTFGTNLTIEGSAGTIDFASNGGSPFDIEGMLVADPTILNSAASTFTVDGKNWTNHGYIQARNGSTIIVGAGLANLAGGTLTGGAWEADTGGSLFFLVGGITTNAATIILDGANSRLTTLDRSGNVIDALSSFAVNSAAASLTIRNGSTITTAGDLSNSGAVIVGPSSTLTVSRNFSEESMASLETDLGGSPDSGQFGQVVILGTAALDGTLRSSFVNRTPPAPARGDVFSVLTFQGRGSSDFATFDLPANPVAVDHVESATAVMLTVGPEAPPAIIVSPTSGLVTTQGGGTATFHVSLVSAPLADVIIPLHSDNTSEGTVPASITLTTANASAGVDVTVTGVDDHVLAGNVSYRIIVGPTHSADMVYNNLSGNDVVVTNHQSDKAAILVNPTSGLTTTKSGGQAQFTVVLSTIPSDTVRINLTSSNPVEGTPSPAFLVFTPLNALTPQTVTVTGHDDRSQNGDQKYMVITSGAISNDANYRGINPPDVSLTNLANEVSIDVNPVTGLVTTENGGPARFTVTLSTHPTANVEIALQSSNPAQGIPTVSSLTFTPGGPLSQLVMVQGVNDSTMHAPIRYTIVLGPAVSSDPRFNGIVPADVSLTNVDNNAGLVITPLTNYDSASAVYQTSEDGATASFQVSLSTKPSQPVTVTLSIPSPGSDQAAASPTQLTFTSANYLMPQTVTLTGYDNVLPGEDSPYTVHFSLTSADSHYNGIKVPFLHAVNLADGLDAGIILAPMIGFVNGEFLVDETGGTATFSLALATIPTDSVTLTLKFSDTSIAMVSSTTLIFPPNSTALNPLMVTIKGLPLSGTSGSNTIALQIGATSNDSNYNTGSHPNLVVLKLGAPARAVLLSNQVLVVDQVVHLDVRVDAPDTYRVGTNQPFLVQVTVTNVNSFAIPQLQVISTSIPPDSVTVVSKPAQTSSSTVTSNKGNIVANIFNLPAQGTVTLSYEFPMPGAATSVASKFDVYVPDSNTVIPMFTGSATTNVVKGAVEWLFLAGVGLLAGGRALERYLRRRRKRRAEAPDSLDVQSSRKAGRQS
jgi:hypothetical protein